MVGTLTGLQWGIYDAYKVWWHFETKRQCWSHYNSELYQPSFWEQIKDFIFR